MTNDHIPANDPVRPPVPHVASPVPNNVPPQRSRNVVGLIALGVAVLGFIFACVPGALVVGWVLLPIGFVLGIVAVCLRDKVKWQGITAIIVSIVGTIVGIIVFFTVVAVAFSNAFGDTEVEIGSDDETSEVVADQDEAADDEAAAAVGTRENPVAVGTTLEGDDWTVVVNSVTLGETDAIVAASPINDTPDEGTEYILINYTVTYTGDDAEGGTPAFVGLEYVTAAGVTVDPLDKILVGPDELDSLSTLYEGASATGNKALQVPSPVDGVLAVKPGMFTDTVFVAVQ